MEGSLGLTPKYYLDIHYAQQNCNLSCFTSLIVEETVKFLLAPYKKEHQTNA